MQFALDIVKSAYDVVVNGALGKELGEKINLCGK